MNCFFIDEMTSNTVCEARLSLVFMYDVHHCIIKKYILMFRRCNKSKDVEINCSYSFLDKETSVTSKIQHGGSRLVVFSQNISILKQDMKKLHCLFQKFLQKSSKLN